MLESFKQDYQLIISTRMEPNETYQNEETPPRPLDHLDLAPTWSRSRGSWRSSPCAEFRGLPETFIRSQF